MHPSPLIRGGSELGPAPPLLGHHRPTFNIDIFQIDFQPQAMRDEQIREICRSVKCKKVLCIFLKKSEAAASFPYSASFMKDTSSTVFISFFSFAHCLVSLNITSFWRSLSAFLEEKKGGRFCWVREASLLELKGVFQQRPLTFSCIASPPLARIASLAAASLARIGGATHQIFAADPRTPLMVSLLRIFTLSSYCD